MRKEYAPQPLAVSGDLPGMSLRSIQEHFKLYQGYVKKTNEIQAKIASSDKTDVSGVYSAYGELRRQETFAVNGMKLHEVYFGELRDPSASRGQDPLTGRGYVGKPPGALEGMIERDFDSLDAWRAEMVATGMSARGWAILAFDFKDNRLHIYGADAQNVGAVWGAIPVVALDVYEHAYFMDHGVNRKPYIDGFFEALDWVSANRILAEYELERRVPL